MEGIVDQNFETIINLIAELCAENVSSVHAMFDLSNSLKLDEDWLLKFDEFGRGYVVVPINEDADSRTRVSYLVCVVAGCRNYTYGGVICEDHPPWLDVVELSDDSICSIDVIAQGDDAGIQLPPVTVSLDECEQNVMACNDSSDLHLDNGIITASLVDAVLDELYETRKGYFGPETSPMYKHQYIVQSIYSWNYWSKKLHVMIRKAYKHSRSLKIESTNGKHVFYTCGHFPYCRKIALFACPVRRFNHYCFEHKTECFVFTGRKNPNVVRQQKIGAFMHFGQLISNGVGDRKAQWDMLFKFLYERGEFGQIFRFESMDFLVKVNVQGQLRVDGTKGGAYNGCCIGGRFSCLLLLKKVEMLYCPKCVGRSDRFSPREIIASCSYGSKENEFVQYW